MIVNPSDWDNEETDDPDFWEEDEVEPCPWCGSDICAHLDENGILTCCVTKKIIP